MKRMVYKMPFSFNTDVMIIVIIVPKYLRYTIEASIILFTFHNKQPFSFCNPHLKDEKTEDSGKVT